MASHTVPADWKGLGHVARTKWVLARGRVDKVAVKLPRKTKEAIKARILLLEVRLQTLHLVTWGTMGHCMLHVSAHQYSTSVPRSCRKMCGT